MYIFYWDITAAFIDQIAFLCYFINQLIIILGEDIAKKNNRVNEEIRAKTVRLIDGEGNQVGIMSFEDALKEGEKRGLDIVEVGPNAKPPVCKLLDYDKFRYQQMKKKKKQQKRSKQSELKQVRLTPRIEERDLDIKISKAKDFLEDGDKVKFMMSFRGRELAHKEVGREIFDKIVSDLSEVGKLEGRVEFEHRKMLALIVPQ